MKTAVVAMLAIAGSAAADIDRSNYIIFQDGVNASISATALDAVTAERGVGTDYYSDLAGSVGGGYSAFAPASGSIGFDDYFSTATNDIQLAEFGFVGGVNQAAGIMFVDFYDSTGSTLLDGFGVALTNAGNFIYTITINASVVVPADGIVEITVPGTSLDATGAPVNTGVLGQWFLGNGGATIGNAGLPVTASFNHQFRLNGALVPAPASAALLGLGGLAAARRRR